jgi:flagellar protein FliO/FliZ
MSIPMTTLLNVATILFIAAIFGWYKFRSRQYSKQKSIKIVTVTHLGNREKLLVIDLNNQHILLGVTQHNIQMLHTYPAPLESTDEAISPASNKIAKLNLSFKSLLKQGMINEKN